MNAFIQYQELLNKVQAKVEKNKRGYFYVVIFTWQMAFKSLCNFGG